MKAGPLVGALKHGPSCLSQSYQRGRGERGLGNGGTGNGERVWMKAVEGDFGGKDHAASREDDNACFW